MRTPAQRLSDAIDIVAGGRDPDARRALVADLPHAPQLAAVVAGLEVALAPMAAEGGEVAPPEDLFARIEAVLDAETAIATYATNIRHDDPGWIDINPGVRRRYLWDEHTYIAQIQPGYVFPRHDHASVEHCLVISGDLIVDDVVFGPGDYHAPTAGSQHGRIRTEGGLLVLIRRKD